MAYGVKYICEFDNIVEDGYKIELLKKGYAGGTISVIGGSRPFLHSWDNDDPKAAIKGSSAIISLINENDTLPLSTFYSDDDDEWKVRYYYGSQLLFEGFLVQDDCQEIMVDYTHEINLSANDNLGLLKDIPLNKTLRDQITIGADVEFIASHTIVISTPLEGLLIGDQIGFSLNDIFYSNFTINSIEVDSGSTTLIVDEIVANATNTFFVKYYTYKDISGLQNIITLLHCALYATGLELDTNTYANLIETSVIGQAPYDTQCFIEYTKIDTGTFLTTTKNYESCYDVLIKILGRFKLTLFQAYGKWQLIRTDELRYYSNALPYFKYDSDFGTDGTGTLSEEINFGFGLSIYPELGLLRRIQRPYKFAKEQFDYRQPNDILLNADLLTLGVLISTYTSGSNTIYEYEMPYWFDGFTAPYPDRFIRVVYDNLNNETERYVVVEGATGDTSRSVRSSPIIISAGDKVKFSFQFRTDVSQGGPLNRIFALRLTDGINNYYVDDPDGDWQIGLGWTVAIAGGDNTNIWHSVEIESKPAPIDGIVYCYLADCTNADPDETHYKDIRFEYTPYINESTKIIGHTHLNEQQGVIKNNSDITIYVDDSPRYSIKGTLFTPFTTGSIQDRSVYWQRDTYVEEKKIGEIITLEQLFWRRKQRTILEGSIRGVRDGSKHVSPLSVFNYAELPDLYFISGRLEIDYKNNQFTTTLYEQYDANESDSDLTSDYNFNYLYDTK